MRYSEQFMEHVEYTINAFCKIVLRHEAIGRLYGRCRSLINRTRNFPDSINRQEGKSGIPMQSALWAMRITGCP